MVTKPIPSRSFFRFDTEVKHRFSFLEFHGFWCVHSEATFVQFKSIKCAISIYHGRLSYEIGLDIEFQQSQNSYSIAEIQRLKKYNFDSQYRKVSARSVKNVADVVHKLANLFEQCVNAGVLTDDDLIPQLEYERKKWGHEFALRVELSQALEKSTTAWQKKDFNQFVQILTPLQEHLSQVNIKKLEYALKKISDTSD